MRRALTPITVAAAVAVATPGPAAAEGQPDRPVVVVKVDGGFHWADAAIGAAAAAGLGSVATGALVVFRKRNANEGGSR
jgi:hypothetical protein